MKVENMHNECHNLYSSPNIIRKMKSRRMRWVGHVAHMAEKKNVYKILIGKPEGKRPLRRHRCRWEENIKKDLKERRGGWTGFIWFRIGISGVLMNMVMNIGVP
jgi:hypothetical protein